MPEVKTLQFLNTPAGQARKNEALVEHLQAGWTIVSETVTPGHMKGGQACCLAFICLPLGFAAGRTDGVISVTLQRRGEVVSANHSVKVTTTKHLVSANQSVKVTTTKPLSQNSRRALLGLLGLFAIVFVFGLFQKGKSPQAKNKKEESKAVTPVPPQGAFTRMSPAEQRNGRPEVIPYEGLAEPQNVSRPSFTLRLQGWAIGREIHNKYGLRSDQPMLFDYGKVLHRSKDQVDAHLGQSVKTSVGEFQYKKRYGTLIVRFKDSRAHQLEVEFTQVYDSYISVLRSVGINKLVRPFAINHATLLFNPNMGNSLTLGPPFVNVAINIPNPPDGLGDRKQWRIAFSTSS